MSDQDFLTPEQMRKTHFYERLNVKRGCSDQELEAGFRSERERYRAFILKRPSYTECYYLIEEAYNYLKDPEFRKSLDYAETELIPEQNEHNRKVERRRKTLLIVKWIIAIVITHAIVGMIAYNSPPPGKSIMNTGIACLALGIVVSGSMAKAKQSWNAGIMFLLTVTLVVNAAVFWFNYRKHKVYLDNQNNFEVLIKVDGEKLMTVAPYGFVNTSIRLGNHKIESFKMPGDSVLESFDVEIGQQNRYMYNVLSSGKYITGTESYSSSPALNYINGDYAPDYPEMTISERWMKMNYDFIFSKPPQEITVRTNTISFGTETAERDYIIRADAAGQYW